MHYNNISSIIVLERKVISMAKLKGVKKLNKAISTELKDFKVNAVLDTEFAMFMEDRIIGYKLDVNTVDKWFDEYIYKTFGFDVGENDFVISLLHEIGHFKTLNQVEQKTYDKAQKEIAKIQKKLEKVDTERKEKNLHFKYFSVPTEIIATAWAVEWARNHPKKYKKMCKNTLLAIQEFYKINNVTDD